MQLWGYSIRIMTRKRYPRGTPRPCKTCPTVFVPPPDGNQSHTCPACVKARNSERYQAAKDAILARNRKWRKKHGQPGSPYMQRQLKLAYERRAKRKDEVYAHYGDRCECCGETERMFLTIDHIDGNGNAHRREIKKADLAQWLWQNGMPAGFRILCYQKSP